MPKNYSDRYCPYCGQSALAAWKHCPACGKELPERTVTYIPGITAVDDGSDRNKKWREVISQIRNGEPDKASISLSALLQSFPQDAEALALLGSICLHQYKIDKASDYLERAVVLAPDSTFVRMKMAEYWVALGIPARALEELDKAEAFAADDLYLRSEIIAYSKHVREKTGGNIVRAPPPLPNFGSFGFFKKKQPKGHKK